MTNRDKRVIIVGLLLFFLINIKIGGEVVSDNLLGYTITLPDGWVRQVVDSIHHTFEDTTGKLNSLIGIKVYNLQDYQSSFTEKEWTETNFWVYYLLASVESTNVVLYYDTIIATDIHKRFTADIYTFSFDPEGSMGDIAEYVRYTAAGNKGYEIYAIGPLSDMDTNLIYYLTIIESITITTTDLNSKVKIVPINTIRAKEISSLFFKEVDLLGRNIKNKKFAFQIYFSDGKSNLLIKKFNK